MKKLLILSTLFIVSFCSAQVQIPNLPLAKAVDDTDYVLINKNDSNISKVIKCKDLRTYIQSVKKTVPVPFDSTGTISATNILRGWITSTSGAATTITTPTASQIATALSNAGQGTTFTFVVDNTAGSNTVTISLGSNIAALSVITGGNTLTVSSGSLGSFKLLFYSTTQAKIAREE